MDTIISHSALETEAVGESLARSARPGLILALLGDLGAGKTQLVRGLARGLGAPGRVRSPTFALVNVDSRGRLPLYHLDLYRLNGREDVLRTGLEPYLLQQDGVTAIEWAERWLEGDSAKHLPDHWQVITLETLGPDERQIRLGRSA